MSLKPEKLNQDEISRPNLINISPDSDGRCDIEMCLICYTDSEHFPKSIRLSSSCGLLHEYSDVYFILKCILELPSEQLKSYQDKCSTCPEKWPKICAVCKDSYVEKCGRIFKELLEIQRKFAVARKELIGAIKKSVVQVESGRRKVTVHQNNDLTHEIRRFIRDERYDFTVEDSPGNEENMVQEEIISAKSINDDLPFQIKEEDSNDVDEDEVKEEPTSDLEDGSRKSFEVGASDNENDDHQVSQDEDQDWSGSRSALSSDIETETEPSSATDEDEQFKSKNKSNRKPPTKRKGRLRKVDCHPCPVCSFNCRSAQSLKNHIVHRHPDHEQADHQPPLTCPTCLKQFKNAESLRLHNSRFHPKKDPNLQCNQCGKYFRTKKRLQNHKAIIHTGNDNPSGERFVCSFPLCGKGFSSKHLLEYHERYHKPPTLFCSICGKGYRFKRDLQRHDLSHENKLTKPFMCDICPAFACKDGLRVHLKENHQDGNDKEETSQHPCPNCGKVFANKPALSKHIKSRHENKQVVTCELCGKLIEQVYLEKHKERMHNNPLPVSCAHPGCKRRFCTEEVMQRHFVVHDNRTEFTCDKCGKVVRRKQSLKTHIERMHLNKETKPFSCEICDKRFADKKYLRLHMKTHSKS